MELVDVVVVDGRCAGIVTRDLLTGEFTSHAAHAVVLATGGYGNAFFLSTNAMAVQRHRGLAGPPQGRRLRQPVLHADPPDVHPAVRRLPVEADADVRVAAQRRPGVGAEESRRRRARADQIPEDERDYYLERLYPSFGNLAPRDISSRAAKRAVDSGRGVGPLKNGVYLDFSEAIDRLGKDVVEERYGNLFEMYERITGENPYDVPMRIYPASHYTMGGLWVDYELMTTIPGLYCAGEANFSDHGANRLGASALMQGLADGYFVLPYTISNYLAADAQQADPRHRPRGVQAAPRRRPATASDGYLAIGGTRSPDHFHRELGKIIWDYCGMERTEDGPREGAVGDPRAVRGVQEGPARHRRRRRASTRRSRRPAASTTSSSSAC